MNDELMTMLEDSYIVTRSHDIRMGIILDAMSSHMVNWDIALGTGLRNIQIASPFIWHKNHVAGALEQIDGMKAARGIFSTLETVAHTPEAFGKLKRVWWSNHAARKRTRLIFLPVLKAWEDFYREYSLEMRMLETAREQKDGADNRHDTILRNVFPKLEASTLKLSSTRFRWSLKDEGNGPLIGG